MTFWLFLKTANTNCLGEDIGSTGPRVRCYALLPPLHLASLAAPEDGKRMVTGVKICATL